MTVGTWRRRKLASVAGVTEYPPGPSLAALATVGAQVIEVTGPGFDNIGSVLSAIGVEFVPFSGSYACDLLFLNCGTRDTIDPARLRDFVERGGCLYASDLTSGVLSRAFPDQFQFNGTGSAGEVQAEVADEELQSVIGDVVDITFDMGAWSVLAATSGMTLVRAAGGSPYAGKPLMVELDVGLGAVFYTSFHNKAQLSDRESALLKLLVLKQLGVSTHRSIAQVGQSLGLNLMALKKS